MQNCKHPFVTVLKLSGNIFSSSQPAVDTASLPQTVLQASIQTSDTLSSHIRLGGVRAFNEIGQIY